jgi:hypothetical protein
MLVQLPVAAQHKSLKPTPALAPEPVKNVVTLGVLSFVDGYIPVNYERKINKHFAIRVGVGITFRSVFYPYFSGGNEEGGGSDVFPAEQFYQMDSVIVDVPDHYDDYGHRKAKLGYYFSLAPKLYFKKGASRGFFISPAFEYKQYNFEARQPNEIQTARYITYSDAYTKEYMKCMDVTFTFGKTNPMPNHFAIAWSLGFGARFLNTQRLDAGAIRNEYGYTYRSLNAVHQYKMVKPLFTFNITIGGWF